MASKITVIGDGWSALASVGFLATAGHSVHWIAGTGARVVPPLPSLEMGPGVAGWQQLARRLGVETGPMRQGSLLREFRNKAFREPAWAKSPTEETRRETREEMLWSPETRFAPVFEAAWARNLAELEDELRRKISELPNVSRLEGVPITGFRFNENESGHPIEAVILGSGEELVSDRVIYADRWSVLPGLTGLPKGLPFIRGRGPSGVLQAMFTHEPAIVQTVEEGFYSAVHKEAGEEFQRHVWGYFFADGSRSVWTLFMAAEEVEDNHQIAKKLRRMKQALDRMFTGTEWLPEGKPEFMATVISEQVRFEEAVVFSGGEAPKAPFALAKAKGLSFLTDGYGPSSALEQVVSMLAEELTLASVVDESEGQEPQVEALEHRIETAPTQEPPAVDETA